jgi:acetyltransferase-like isoleucine patch superfamily enzyme
MLPPIGGLDPLPAVATQRHTTTIGKPIVIEKNVWIAAGAIIIGGVVGENSVVAAGSVVTKDIPPNTPWWKSGEGHSVD